MDWKKTERNPQKTADLFTFTEEIIRGKLNFLCIVRTCYCYNPFTFSLGRTQKYNFFKTYGNDV